MDCIPVPFTCNRHMCIYLTILANWKPHEFTDGYWLTGEGLIWLIYALNFNIPNPVLWCYKQVSHNFGKSLKLRSEKSLDFGSVTRSKIIEFWNNILAQYINKFMYFIKKLFTGILLHKWSRKTFTGFPQIWMYPQIIIYYGGHRISCIVRLAHLRAKANYNKHKHMMASSNGNIFRVTGHLCGEFTGHRWIPRTKASDAELWCFFYLRFNKRLSKQWWC